MNRRRMIILVIVSLIIIGASYWLTTLEATGSRVAAGSPASTQASISLDDATVVNTTRTTAELIAFWQARFERDPRDYISLTYLGQTYINQGRETGDAGAYAKAEAALRQSLELNPNYESALAYLSTVLFVQHDFQGALELASRVYAFDPRALYALGTIGDAHLELGHYADAETAYRELLERNPSPPVYSRLARLAWLHGQPDEAITLMQQAVDEVATLGLSEDRAAWYHFQLGELYFNTGHLDEAKKHYAVALDLFDDYYLALAGLGKVHTAQGDYDRAIELYEHVVARVPGPGFLAALGDLYLITGRPETAQRHYDTVDFIGDLEAINNVIYNRQLANFYADHDLHLDDALRLATTELKTRHDVYGFDTAAWAYYKNDRPDEAQALMDRAMQLGTRDARLTYHAGMIALARGQTREAQRLLAEALTLNPYFDLRQAHLARTTLEQLQAK